jgi:hypothetical protein
MYNGLVITSLVLSVFGSRWYIMSRGSTSSLRKKLLLLEINK